MMLMSNIFLLPMFAMDKITNDERKEILKSIARIKSAERVGEDWFGSFQAKCANQDFYFNVIDRILNKHRIVYSKERTWAWLAELSKSMKCSNEEDLKRFRETGECTDCFLSYTDLREIINSLNDRDMPINLKQAQLHKSNLSGTDLSNANFELAELSQSDLSNVNLANSNLSHANLILARLTNANLKNANLTNARIAGGCTQGANFRGANWSGVFLLPGEMQGAIVDGPIRKKINVILNYFRSKMFS